MYTYLNSFNISYTFILQTEVPLFIIFYSIYSILIIVTLMEINRSPFDLVEAENELISGYHVELGGFFFGLFYLAEYFHLFFFSVLIVTLFTGLI
jgi:NADH-quinone oxidoreductase subunit H